MFRHGQFNNHTHANSAPIYEAYNTLIVKGYEPSHRPWMTFIQIKKDNSKFKCGGSIINNYWILSAGHCFCEQLKCKPTKKGNLKIDYNLQEHVRIFTGQSSEPVKIHIHPL